MTSLPSFCITSGLNGIPMPIPDPDPSSTPHPVHRREPITDLVFRMRPCADSFRMNINPPAKNFSKIEKVYLLIHKLSSIGFEIIPSVL